MSSSLGHSAALIDRSNRHRLVVRGAGAVDALNGLVTNDVTLLEPGFGQLAAALTPKGKIVALLRIFRRADGSFLVDCDPLAAEGWMGIVRKYVNPRSAAYTVQTEEIADIGVFGTRASEMLATALAMPVDELRALHRYASVEAEWRAEKLMVAAVPDLDVEGFEIFGSSGVAPDLREALVAGGCEPADNSAWEIARIESGTPEWGVEIDESTLVQEANLEQLHAVSFTKGCYTGQETVARVHFRGHVNRHLRALRFPSVDVPPRAAPVFGAEDRAVGEVKSSAYSPRDGGVAIAMLRREVPPGSTVTVRWEQAECQATVHELPLPRDSEIGGLGD
jgi:folate-binding protein YgfZ